MACIMLCIYKKFMEVIKMNAYEKKLLEICGRFPDLSEIFQMLSQKLPIKGGKKMDLKDTVKRNFNNATIDKCIECLNAFKNTDGNNSKVISEEIKKRLIDLLREKKIHFSRRIGKKDVKHLEFLT